jgi:UDP-2,4-diacetamido-2,4,6-trideoxy-beta-L-altropyranose hydrolase
MSQLFFIRTDASLQIGSGHVMRCLTLAEALRGAGGTIAFITRNHLGNLNDYIKSKGFNVHSLPDRNESNLPESLSGYEKWLGVKQDQDAKDTIQALSGIRPDWLIVDHYALDARWEKYLANSYRRLMVIDDIADRRHECDLLLDQNLFEDMPIRYQGKLPEKCIQLLGPRYALLQPDYPRLRTQAKPRKAPLNHLLVFFGGADRYNLTGLTLSALEQINTPFECVDVVISRQSPYYEKVKDLAVHSPKIQLHSDLPSLAPLMMKADLAIGAGGAANWERFCLGLPSLVITLAENQRPVNRDLYQMRLIEWIGDVETIQINYVSSAIEGALSRNDIKNWSEHCMNACSGLGTSLVTDSMMKISTVQ